MEKKFTIGTSVQLKSGGPAMTVEGYDKKMGDDFKHVESDTSVLCTWFDSKNQRCKDIFHQDTLEEYDSNIYI